MKNERRARNVDNICKYGIGLLDEVLGGILENELVIVGAGTGVGKTELACQIARENAMRGKKVALYSLEGDMCEIAYRYAQSRINHLMKQQTGRYIKGPSYRLNIEDVNAYEDAVEGRIPKEMDNIGIFDNNKIPDKKALLESIRNVRKDVDMFIIDHLHYLNFGENEYEGLSEMIRAIKETTEIIRKPIVLVCHLSKEFFSQKRDPTPYDLHGSSNIQKNANTVILLSQGQKTDIETSQDPLMSPTKIIIGKSRSGVKCPTALYAHFNIATKEYEKGKQFNTIINDF